MHLQQYIVVSRRTTELDASGSGELNRPETFLSEIEALRYAENLAGEKTGYDDRHRYSFVMLIDVKQKQDADGGTHLRYVLFRGDWPNETTFPKKKAVAETS